MLSLASTESESRHLTICKLLCPTQGLQFELVQTSVDSSGWYHEELVGSEDK